MSKLNIKVPSMGEGITDVTIIRWLVDIGNDVEPEQPIAEVATDKVDTEILAPEEGKLVKKMFNENDIAPVGNVLAVIEVMRDTKNEEELTDNEITTDEFTDIETDENNEFEIQTVTIQKHRFIPPYIRSLALDYNIPLEDLYSLKGSGKDNELLADDIRRYIIKKKSEEKETTKLEKKQFEDQKKRHQPFVIEQNLIENSEIIEMDRMRKLIANHMVMSKSVSPHVTSFIEADVSNLVMWRNKIKDRFLKETGEKLTYTPIFIEAVVNALKKYPMVNASIDEDHIYLKKFINIGVATALTDGNLIVPVIKDADKENLVGLATKVNDIVSRARINQLNTNDVKDGTFTITNLGNFESLAGTPIINQPEVAILAIGAITRKPAVVKVNGIETIGIRDIVMLSLAYDHRIIDGSLGGMFLKSIKDTLQDFNHERKVF